MDEIFYLLETIEKKGKKSLYKNSNTNNKDKKSIGFIDLAAKSGFPIPIILLLFKELEKQGIISISKGDIILNTELSKPIENNLDFSKERLVSDPGVCQLVVAQESVAERVDYMAKNCPAGGRIAILGDDDFMSISLAGKKLFEKIIVFEIDKKIVDKIKKIAEEKNLPIYAVQHDLREQFTKEWQHKFDAFYTDPPYSPSGFSLFISRGIQLLKKEPKKHGFASYSPEAPIIEDLELPVQGYIRDMGLFIKGKSMGALNVIPDYLYEKFPDFEELRKQLFKEKKEFTELDEWFLAALGRKEFLFHFLTTLETKPLIKGKYTDEIYYKDKPLSFYTDEEFIKKSRQSFDKYHFY